MLLFCILMQLLHVQGCIIVDRVMRTRKQSGVRRILKVCKERVRVSEVNTHSQISVTNTSFLTPIKEIMW